MRIFYRSLRRSGLRLHFTQGFHPLPRISFYGALPVGIESLMETMDIELEQPYPNLEVIGRLNNVLPGGITILKIEELCGEKNNPKPDRHVYIVKSPAPVFSLEKVKKFIEQHPIPCC